MSEWQEVKIGDVLDKIIGGGTPSMGIPIYWGGDTFWCSVKDMPTDRFKLSETKDKITLEGLNNSSTNLIPKNTVIISTRMGLGKAFINEVDMAINQDLKALIYLLGTSVASLVNIFFMYLIRSKRTEDASPFCNVFTFPFTVNSEANERYDAPSMTSMFISFTLAYIWIPRCLIHQIQLIYLWY